MKVVVTGSASPLAQALVPLLAADAGIELLIGVDRRATDLAHPKFTQIVLDVRSSQIVRVLAGADAVVHLATAARPAEASPGREERAALRDFNINGGQNVMRSAAQQRVASIVHLSSAAVYALPARQRPIDEKHPRAAVAGFALAEDQVALEEWLDAFEQEHDHVRLVRLRPHAIVGVNGSPLVRRLLRLPFSVNLAGGAPRFQCVHALDVAHAIQQALFRDTAGAFNLACADAESLRAMQRLRGGGLIPLPFALAHRLFQLTAGVGTGADSSWMECLRHEIVLDTKRARRHLGWKPQYDTVRACLRARD